MMRARTWENEHPALDLAEVLAGWGGAESAAAGGWSVTTRGWFDDQPVDAPPHRPGRWRDSPARCWATLVRPHPDHDIDR